MIYCQTCGEYTTLISGHTCDPEWECEVGGEGWGKARGQTRLDAAEKAAEWYWQDDPPDSGDTVEVSVKDDGVVVVFRVTADWSLDVTASRKDGGS